MIRNRGVGKGTQTAGLNVNSHRNRGAVISFALAALCILGTRDGTAQTVKINTRCLTPQEKKSYPASTQLASGVPNVGIGQPVYLEALATKATVVTQVVWTLVSRPTGSAAVLQDSPLTNAPYDNGDRLAYNVVGRKKLVPDVVGSTLKGDYRVVATLRTAAKIYAATNTIFGSKYQGMLSEDGFACEMCHPDKIPAYTRTPHSDAFTRKINGTEGTFRSTCASCHVLGYDTTGAANNGGFDDVATQVGWIHPANLTNAATLPLAATNWASMPAALQAKANIQCENCHGPGYRHMLGGGSTSMPGRGIGISLSGGNCGQCHDSMTHHSKNFEWGQSLHGATEVFRTGSCAPCHTTKGFIDANDPGIEDDGDIVVTRGTYNEGITCVACHDPHALHGEGQLRPMAYKEVKLGDPAITNGHAAYPAYAYPIAVVTNGGLGRLCMNCHRVRNRASEYFVNTTTTSTSGSGLTPHEAPQADMLAGKNAIQYGMQMPSSRHLDVVENSCVQCHMQETPTSGPALVAKNKVGAHTFKISWTNATTTVHLTEACKGCHGEIENFNFGGEDYDRDGAVEGVQSEITGLMATLASLLPKDGTGAVDRYVRPTTHSLSQRRGVYNYFFVKYDGSHGVHNPKYAAAILQASIDELRGGIDVDRDGLRDAWETTNFGNISAQSGSDDWDGDGLPNAQEQSIGTNPKEKDTDGDGIWDRTEVQAGTDPRNRTSKPGTNEVVIIPAVELGYVPSTYGVTQQFQTVNSLVTPGGWTGLGSPFVSSNAWHYQLISTRDATQRFFRVISLP